MELFRITSAAYIELDGKGAYLYGGRWNSKGTAVIYTATNRALAVLEKLVQVNATVVPEDMVMLTIQVPPQASIIKIEETELLPSWSNYPPPEILKSTGDQWINENQSLLLEVPSALISGEKNILINPAIPEFHKIKITNIEAFSFDERLLKKG